MRPVTAAFLATIRGSHEISSRATVLTTFQTGTAPAGTRIPVIDGSVTLDATADTRGTLDLTTDGTGWDERPGRSIIQPYGSEIFIERGVRTGGSIEWVSQGYYKITQVEQDDSRDGNLTVDASDRMQAIIEATMITDVQFGKTASVEQVFTQLVTDVYPLAVIDFDWDAASDLLGTAQATDGDRHAFLSDLATSRGKAMYFDYRGHLVVATAPDPGSPVWDVDAGPGGVLITGGRTLSRDGVYNAVVVTADGADTTTPPLAIAYDSNPASPTYYDGPFGKVPTTYSSPNITTTDQAKAAAAALLQKSIGLPAQADLTHVPNPALEPLDPVRVVWRKGGSRQIIHVIDQVTVPLTAGTAMTAATHDPTIRVGFMEP